MTISKQVTIFEGPDGGGKSFAAQHYAQLHGARYVHLGPMRGILNQQLGRIYAEAMLPALMGYQDIVLDRCWVSEEPYGTAFREGKFRIQRSHERMLERLAWRCGAVIVICLPGIETSVEHWSRRRDEEMLKHERQLRMVYAWYESAVETERFHLNTVIHNYTKTTRDQLGSDIARVRPAQHPLAWKSAGNIAARVAIVGDTFGEVKDTDLLYQWPFASFSNRGCSRWLTEALHNAGIGEYQLFWANADQLDNPTNGLADHLRQRHVFAFGEAAAAKLARKGVAAQYVHHPDAWNRNAYAETYKPLELIREALANPKETTHA